MRAAAILGPGNSPRNLKPFQNDRGIVWQIGSPSAADQADIILLFGGDGTVHRHLGQLVSLGLPVLVVPTGSGNDFARALGFRSARDSLEAWRRFCASRTQDEKQDQDNVRTIDLGTITPLGNMVSADARDEHARVSECGARHYFCSIAGIGLDSEVTRRANALPRWLRGHGGYALTALRTILRFSSFRMEILNSGEDDTRIRSDQPTTLAAFANTAIYGGGMKIAPHAQMDDGKLDVCMIAGISKLKLACMFPTVYFGRHLRLPEVAYFQASALRVETEAPVDIYADGEYICCTPAEIGIARSALKVLVPCPRC